MVALTTDKLLAACTPGGASVLTFVTELQAAAGPHGGVSPARFVRGSKPTYAFERRFVSTDDSDQKWSWSVVIDSKGSSINRVEAALSQAIRDGIPPVNLTPRMQVTYEGAEPQTCLDIPHRAFDGHFRAGAIDGVDVPQSPTYRAVRNTTHANALPMLEMSPVTLAFGGWDSTRRSNQARFRSALVGEVIGVLADQSASARDIDPRGAARYDTIAPSVRLSGEQLQELLVTQREHLSPKKVEEIEKAIKGARKTTISAAMLGLGAIPPSLDGLGQVACSRIVRSHVLSFSALRQLRFGLGPDGDVRARVLLAALALNGLVRSYAELNYRANCDLVEVAPPNVVLDGRYGVTEMLVVPEIEDVDQLLREAIDAAVAAGVRWEGQVFDVVGNPIVAGSIIDDESDDGE